MSLANGYGGLAFTALQPQAGPIQGQSLLPCPSMGLLLISSPVAIIRNKQVGRHHSPTASWIQHCTYQLIPIQTSYTELGAFLSFPQGWRWTPVHSLVRHRLSEATSIRQPQGSSLMKCSWSTHRHSYSRGRQQGHHRPLQKGPTQGGVCSRTLSRSPFRCVLLLLSLSCPQYRDKQLHYFFSCLYLQPHQQEPLEEGDDLTQPNSAPEYTARCSVPYRNQWLRILMWKQVQFDLADDMGNAPQSPPDLAGFLEWPEDATNEWGGGDAQSPSTHSHMPFYTTWGDHAKEGGWPVVLYYCQGSQTQVHCFLTCWVYKSQWSQTQMQHHTRPDQTAKGWGQGIHCEDEGTTQLVARVPLFGLEVYKSAPHDLSTTASHETGCTFLAFCSPSWGIGIEGSSPQSQHSVLQQFPLTWAPQSCCKWSGGPYSMMCSTARVSRVAWPTWCSLRRGMSCC